MGVDNLFPLSAEERARIIKEIAQWKVEAERGKITDEDIGDYIGQLRKKSDSELFDFWNQTVGRWILSRNDVVVTDDSGMRLEDGQKIVEKQFECIVKGEPREYGFVYLVHVAADESNGS